MRHGLAPSIAAIALALGVGVAPAAHAEEAAPAGEAVLPKANDYGDTNPVNARDRGDYPGFEQGTDETFNANNEMTNEVIDREQALKLGEDTSPQPVTGEEFDELREQLADQNVEGEMLDGTR